MNQPPDGTLCLPDPDARASVVKSLLATASRNNPGSCEYELANQAVELALSPERAADNPAFLTRNVKRDAARFLKNKQDPEVFLSTLEAGLKKKASSDNEPPSVETALPPAKTPEPVDELAATELEDRVRTAVQDIPIGEDSLAACSPTSRPATRPNASVSRSTASGGPAATFVSVPRSS